MQRSPMGNCLVPVGRIASQRVSEKSLTDYEMASRQLPRPTVGTGSESGKTSGGGAAPRPNGRPRETPLHGELGCVTCSFGWWMAPYAHSQRGAACVPGTNKGEAA